MRQTADQSVHVFTRLTFVRAAFGLMGIVCWMASFGGFEILATSQSAGQTTWALVLIVISVLSGVALLGYSFDHLVVDQCGLFHRVWGVTLWSRSWSEMTEISIVEDVRGWVFPQVRSTRGFRRKVFVLARYKLLTPLPHRDHVLFEQLVAEYWEGPENVPRSGSL